MKTFKTIMGALLLTFAYIGILFLGIYVTNGPLDPAQLLSGVTFGMASGMAFSYFFDKLKK